MVAKTRLYKPSTYILNQFSLFKPCHNKAAVRYQFRFRVLLVQLATAGILEMEPLALVPRHLIFIRTTQQIASNLLRHLLRLLLLDAAIPMFQQLRYIQIQLQCSQPIMLQVVNLCQLHFKIFLQAVTHISGTLVMEIHSLHL